MTSTTFKFRPLFFVWIAVIFVMVACNDDDKIVTKGDLKNRVPTVSTQAEPQEQPKSPPTTTAPADKSDDAKEAPYFGSTYWDELLTSVYYYPDDKRTHLKFNHRDDDIWLCGDLRKNFEPGNRYKLAVTFEPNAPCITNWRVK